MPYPIPICLQLGGNKKFLRLSYLSFFYPLSISLSMMLNLSNSLHNLKFNKVKILKKLESFLRNEIFDYFYLYYYYDYHERN